MDTARRAGDLPGTFEPLKAQLLAAAGAFATDAHPLSSILCGLVDDVERAIREPLEIIPVAHHSPSSGLQVLRRLASRPPRVVFLEGCEDLTPALEGLRDCRLPVALQAFAAESNAFPASWFPLNVVCPLTEFSAEFQAIAFAMQSENTELVFVDRSADHLFQWLPREPDAVEKEIPRNPDADDEDAGLHGSAVGVEVGSLVPSLDRFRASLLKNARVSHFSEWWDQYVEEAVIDEDYSSYREVFFLIGSLFRRLGIAEADVRQDELRERFMWTRMKEYLRDRSVDPGDAVYICGAAHAASRVDEFGAESSVLWDVPPRSSTSWHYGLIPSSYSAICHQFGHPRGVLTLAEARWRKGLAARELRSFALKAQDAETDEKREHGGAAQPRWNRQPDAMEAARPTAQTEEASSRRPACDLALEPVASLVASYPATTNALANALGLSADWTRRPTGVVGASDPAAAPGEPGSVRCPLRAYPDAVEAAATVLGLDPFPVR